MSSPQIFIQYTCQGCDVEDRDVAVRERAALEDVVAWVNAVIIIVSCDHETYRPDCLSPVFNLKMPMRTDIAEGVGKVVRQ